MFRRQLPAAIGMVFIFTVLTGLVYPLVVTAIGQLAFHDKAEGSLVEVDGEVVGSSLDRPAVHGARVLPPAPFRCRRRLRRGGQLGLEPRTDQPRLPGHGRASASLPTATENGLDDDVAVPVDAVTASASGLDPHISVANAELQAPRVATARGIDLARRRAI